MSKKEDMWDISLSISYFINVTVILLKHKKYKLFIQTVVLSFISMINYCKLLYYFTVGNDAFDEAFSTPNLTLALK